MHARGALAKLGFKREWHVAPSVSAVLGEVNEAVVAAHRQLAKMPGCSAMVVSVPNGTLPTMPSLSLRSGLKSPPFNDR